MESARCSLDPRGDVHARFSGYTCRDDLDAYRARLSSEVPKSGGARVNLKAEFEIRSLHEKIDHMLVRQWQRRMEIQQLQTDLLSEMRSGR